MRVTMRLEGRGVTLDGAAFGIIMGVTVGGTSAVRCGVATRVFIGHHGSRQRCALHFMRRCGGLSRMKRALCAPYM